MASFFFRGVSEKFLVRTSDILVCSFCEDLGVPVIPAESRPLEPDTCNQVVGKVMVNAV